jgi:uncharacterized membrane protein YecN with MAPEG domain
MLPVTALYAGLLAFGFLYLSVRTIQQRTRYHLALGTGHRLVERAARAHGNFAEYVPLALVLIGLCESNGLPGWALHVLGVTLLVARGCHAYGISQEPEVLRWRMVGTSVTFTMLAVAAASALGLAFAGL